MTNMGGAPGPELPLHTAKTRSGMFYGWWILIACFIIGAYTGGTVVFGFTAFFAPLVKEFGWSYAQVSLAASLRGVETGLLSPVLGFLVDRWGSRWVAFFGSLVTGLGFIFVGFVNSLGTFYLGFILIAFGISGVSPAVLMPAAGHWFRRRLGLATGVVSCGFAFGGLVIPLLTYMIETLQWRATVIIVGASIILVCLPLALVLRPNPQKYGYQPDGESLAVAPSPTLHPLPQRYPKISAREVLRTPAFWHLTLCWTIQYVATGAVLAHIMPFLGSVGFDRGIASFFAGALALVSVIGRFGAGWLGDITSKKRIAIVSFFITMGGFLLFDYVTPDLFWLLILAVALFSIGNGMGTTLRAILLQEYFGPSKFATIYGFGLGILAVGGILGPWIAGLIFDVWQSYHFAWWLFIALNTLGLIILWTTPPARPALAESG